MTMSMTIDNDADGYDDHKGNKFRPAPKQIPITLMITEALVLVRIQSGVKIH